MENNNQHQNQQQEDASKKEQRNQQTNEKFDTDGGLKKNDGPDIPDSTNESTGVTGSGQRQDSN